MNRKIIYIDDEELNLQLFKEHFKKNYDVYATSSQLNALEIIERECIQVVITDYKMPFMNGLELIDKIKENHPETICMVLSGFLETEVVADKSKVFNFISKPFKKEELIGNIENAFKILNPGV
jgi:DNA-binding NtrC family response regulator